MKSKALRPKSAPTVTVLDKDGKRMLEERKLKSSLKKTTDTVPVSGELTDVQRMLSE